MRKIKTKRISKVFGNQRYLYEKSMYNINGDVIFVEGVDGYKPGQDTRQYTTLHYDYKYDDNGKKIWMKNFETGVETSYVYNDLGQLVSCSDSIGGKYNYIYDDNGNKVQEIWNHQTMYLYEYNGHGDLIQLKNRDGLLLSCWGYRYDEYGRKTYMMDNHDNEHLYLYNKDGYVIQEKVVKDGNIINVIESGYNKLGDIITRRVIHNDSIKNSIHLNVSRYMTTIFEYEYY